MIMLAGIFGVMAAGLCFGYLFPFIRWIRQPRDVLLGANAGVASLTTLLYSEYLQTAVLLPAMPKVGLALWLPFAQAFLVYSLVGFEIWRRSGRNAKVQLDGSDPAEVLRTSPASIFGDLALLLPGVVLLALLLNGSFRAALQEIGVIVVGCTAAAVLISGIIAIARHVRKRKM